MKLKVDFIENELSISDDSVLCIEIENKRYFYRLVKNLYGIYNDNYSEEVHFFEDEKEINNPNIILFNDYFNFDFTSKRYTTEIQKLITNSIDDNLIQELMKSYKKLNDTFKKILFNIDLPLIINQDYNLESIIKLMKISITKKEELLESLFLIIDIEKVLKLNRTIFFINLKQYLLKEEIIELYKYSIYNDINIILIDSQTYGPCLNNEKKIIIDDNLDEFVL